ncbi:hypothetical protein FO519_009830 [Halicephalobus sp. NKZ332]|nr:hypothetical protein FO519_009830 [Halicephalobus sp. NKZ332]
MPNKFASFNKPGIDVLDTLNDVAENSRELLKLGGPVGSLIAAGVDNVFDPASDEQEAIRELHNEMNRQFDAILTRITMLSKTEAEMLISKLENINATRREDLVNVFRDMTIDGILRGTNKKSCMLELVNNAHNHTRVHLLAAVQELTIDLVKTQLMTVACANVTTGGNEEIIQDIVEEATKTVEAIGKHVVLWVRKMQSLSWPEIGIQAAKYVLGFDPIPVTSFNESARKVREEFEKRGAESDSYQVLITDAKEMDTYWSVKTERPGIYARFTDFNGIDCHIFRYDQHGSGRADNATMWFEKKHDALWAGLKHAMYSEYTSGVLVYLHQQIVPIIQSQTYRSAMLLRNKAFWASNARINIGLASWTVPGMNATSNVDFFENDFFAYAWKLYLFL